METNYHSNNLIESFEKYILACSLLLAVFGIITFMVVINKYNCINSSVNDAYVYSTKGAAIHVFVPQTK